MKELSKEEQALLYCVQISPVKRDPVDADYKKIEKEALDQMVPILALNGLFAGAEEKAEIQKHEGIRHWEKVVNYYLLENLKNTNAENNLVRVLEENKIPYVILKGSSVAAYYRNPEDRLLGDVDFLVEKERADEVEELLCRNKFIKQDKDESLHRNFKYAGIPVEMHVSFPGMPKNQYRAKVEAYLSDIFVTAEKTEMNGVKVNYPAPKNQGLILLLHMQRHMISVGIGVRHLLDWAYFVDHTEKESFWEEELLPFLKEIGLYKYARIMTEVSVQYLGLKRPKWLEPVEQELCRKIICDVFSGGDFGNKDAHYRESGHLVSTAAKSGTEGDRFSNLFRSMNESVRIRHPKVKKWPFLYPLFWGERMISRHKAERKGERPAIREISKLAKERKQLYDRMELFQ